MNCWSDDEILVCLNDDWISDSKWSWLELNEFLIMSWHSNFNLSERLINYWAEKGYKTKLSSKFFVWQEFLKDFDLGEVQSRFTKSCLDQNPKLGFLVQQRWFILFSEKKFFWRKIKIFHKKSLKKFPNFEQIKVFFCKFFPQEIFLTTFIVSRQKSLRN